MHREIDHKIVRKQMVLRRKNFLPTLVLTFISFLSLFAIVYFTDPKSSFFIFLFFIDLLLFLFLLISLILANSKRGFIIAVCITIFMLLKMFGIGNILNAILIAGLGIIALIYEQFTKRGKKHILPNS